MAQSLAQFSESIRKLANIWDLSRVSVDRNVMYHIAPQAARAQIQAQGLNPAFGGGQAVGQTPLANTLAHLKGVYLSDYPGLIGLREHSPFEGLQGGPHDIWEVNTQGLPLYPDFPALVEHGAYAEPDHMWFDEGESPEADALHQQYGDRIPYKAAIQNPEPFIQMTGTAMHPNAISPDRLRMRDISEFGPGKPMPTSKVALDVLPNGSEETLPPNGGNMDKFVTTPEQHEERKNWWYRTKQIIPLPKRSALDPQWLKDAYYPGNGPYLYHVSTPEGADSIAREGLFPWNHEQNPRGTRYNDELTPRSDHVYLAHEGAIPRVVNYIEQEGERPSLLRIDMRHLDPSKFNADEDSHAFGNNPTDEKGMPTFYVPTFFAVPGRRMWHDHPTYDDDHKMFVEAHRMKNAGKFPSPKQEQDWLSQYKAANPDFKIWFNLGSWANDRKPDSPENVRHSLMSHGSVAYNGVIPPHAIEKVDNNLQPIQEPNDLDNDSWQQNTLTANVQSGWEFFVSNLTDDDQNFSWQIDKTAALPSHSLTWQPGTEGKGFILNDGSVWTWPTEQMRPEHFKKDMLVKAQGKRQDPGTAFHIQPDGQIWQYGEGRALSNDHRQMIQNADPRLSPSMLPPAPVQADQFGHAQSLIDTLHSQDWDFVSSVSTGPNEYRDSCPHADDYCSGSTGDSKRDQSTNAAQSKEAKDEAGDELFGWHLVIPSSENEQDLHYAKGSDFELGIVGRGMEKIIEDGCEKKTNDEDNVNKDFHSLVPISEEKHSNKKAEAADNSLEIVRGASIKNYSSNDQESADKNVKDFGHKSIIAGSGDWWHENGYARCRCGQGLVYSGGPWTPVSNGQYGQRSFYCPNCLVDFRMPENRPITDKPVLPKQAAREDYRDYKLDRMDGRDEDKTAEELWQDIEKYMDGLPEDWDVEHGIDPAYADQGDEQSSLVSMSLKTLPGKIARIHLSDHPNQPSPHARIARELAQFLADVNDSREFHDPINPIPGHPVPHGCTCNLNHKLDCPIHGLNGNIQLDDSWHIPENVPVGIAGQSLNEVHSPHSLSFVSNANEIDEQDQRESPAGKMSTESSSTVNNRHKGEIPNGNKEPLDWGFIASKTLPNIDQEEPEENDFNHSVKDSKLISDSQDDNHNRVNKEISDSDDVPTIMIGDNKFNESGGHNSGKPHVPANEGVHGHSIAHDKQYRPSFECMDPNLSIKEAFKILDKSFTLGNDKVVPKGSPFDGTVHSGSLALSSLWKFGTKAPIYHRELEGRFGGGFINRWPMVYDRANDQLHYGPEGSIHSQILNRIGYYDDHDESIDQRYDPNFPNGWVGVNPEFDDEKNHQLGRLNGVPYGWYNNFPIPPDVNQAAVNAIRFYHRPSVDPNQPQGFGHAQMMQTRDPDFNWADIDSQKGRNWGFDDSDYRSSNWHFGDYYHLAPTTERERIRQHGLQPARPGWSEHWPKGPGIVAQPEGVYAWPSPEEADGYRPTYRKPMDIWRIPQEQIQDVEPDPLINHGYETNKGPQVIPHWVDPVLHEPFENTDQFEFNYPHIPAEPWKEYYPDAKARQQMGIGFPDRVIGSWEFTADWVGDLAPTIAPAGGGTFYPIDGTAPAHGYQVSVLGHTEQHPKAIIGDHAQLGDALHNFIQQHAAAFQDPSNYVGAWVHGDHLWLEPSQNVHDYDEAVRMGKERNQIAIWDNANGQEIPVGGTGNEPGQIESTLPVT